MKSLLIYAILTYTLSSLCLADDELSHNEIVLHVQAYIASPTTDNAIKAINSIPELFSDPVGSIYSDQLVTILRAGIKNKDLTTLLLAIRLVNIADGAFAEELNFILADAISSDPWLFMSALDKTKDERVIKSLVLNQGDFYFSNICEFYFDRKLTLKQVKAQELNKIKGEAFAILEAEYSECTQQGAQNGPR